MSYYKNNNIEGILLIILSLPMKNLYLVLSLMLIIIISGCLSEATEKADAKTQTVSQEFTEPHRPQFHFTPPTMWMNDPNGMVYLNGEYHLFYQHYPDSTVWGPMHWGHAVSNDMIHWEHLPIALYPDSLGYIFSGSAVVDEKNSSGLGSINSPPMVAVFTYHDAVAEKAGSHEHQSQGIAFSLDNGRSWEKYNGNPVLRNPGNVRDFRDPKVFWHQPSQKWVMTLAVGDHIELYGSENLLSWDKLSEFGQNFGGHGGVWECPDLFPLATGNGDQKWVMLVSINPGGPLGGSATQYFIGNFDGKKFTSDHPEKTEMWIDYGKDNYAGVTWANIPESDGRRLFLGWMSNWQYANRVPTENWRSAMTIPRELTLAETEQGLRLISKPVKELDAIKAETAQIKAQLIEGEINLTSEIPFALTTSAIEVYFTDLDSAKELGVQLSNDKGQTISIGYEREGNRFFVDRTQSGKDDFSSDFPGKFYVPRVSTADSLKMELWFDVASVEMFGDNGEVVMTEIFFPDSDYTQLSLFAREGRVRLSSGTVTQLASIWNNDPNSAK